MTDSGRNNPLPKKSGAPKVTTRDEILEMIKALTMEEFDRIPSIVEAISKCTFSKVDEDRLLQEIKNKTKVTLTTLRADLRNCRGKEPDEYSEMDIATALFETYGTENICYSNSTFMMWDYSGVWVRREDLFVRKLVNDVCKQRKMDYTAHRIKAVTELIQIETYVHGKNFNQYKDSINCLNGELILNSGEWILQPHVREHYFTTQIPVNYDPTAKAPRFTQFLTEIFSGQDDALANAQVVLELIGYSLLSTSKLEAFVILVGNGANGKSVLLEVVEAVIGKKNTAAVQPSKFDSPFQRAHLQGKLANIVTEMSEGEVIADAQLKAITSGELTTAEHKHKAPFDYHPFATCWLATNHLPRTRDFSEALFRRAIVLEFPNKFAGENRDPDLKQKLLSELPGILKLALCAVSKLLRRGCFTTSDNIESAKHKWRIEADQVMQFLDDRCEPRFGAITLASVLYTEYRCWAEHSGITSKISKNAFARRLTLIGYKTNKGTNGARGYMGLVVRAPALSDDKLR